MNIGMCACGGIYCKYCGDPYRAPPSVGTTSTSTTVFAPSADHGISPAQLRARVDVNAQCISQHSDRLSELREKVEGLEKRCESLASQDVLNFGHLTERLDAALKRIEELERANNALLTAMQRAQRDGR